MLELAEDEQQAFIEDSKKRVLGGLKASKRPTFTLVLGAQGVGKSSLTALFENAAVISPALMLPIIMPPSASIRGIIRMIGKSAILQ